MPWTGEQFQEHNHALSPAQSLHAAHIANAILKRSGNEGMAIATANRLIHRDDGGMVPSPGMAPTAQNQNPTTQGIIQRFSALPTETLRELIPRLGNSPMAQIAHRVLQQKQMTPQPQGQQPTPAMAQFGVPAQTPAAVPAPQPMQPPPQYAAGGGMQPNPDTVPILAAGGEFVVAPHHVERWGQGDLKAGHKLLDRFVIDARKHIVKTMTKLKPPVKS